jgi:two-component system sensor histidine kinase UhpB
LINGLLGALLSIIFVFAARAELAISIDRPVWPGVMVFLINTIIISIVGELLKRSKQKDKLNEEALRERNAQLQALGDNLPHAFVYQAITGPSYLPEIVYISDGIYKYLGPKSSEVIKDPEALYKLIPEPDREKLIEARKKAAIEMLPMNIDVRIRDLEGSLKWANIRSQPRMGEEGKLIWDGIFSDITDRKLLEQQLIESQDLLNQTGELAKVGGWSYNVMSNSSTWTLQTYLLHKVNPGEPMDLAKSLAFYHPADRDKVYSQLNIALQTGTPFFTEARKIDREGKTIWIRLNCHPIMESGKVIRLLGVVQDVTERKELEKELEKQIMYNQQLITELVIQENENEKSRLAYELHEDVNQILAAAKMYLDMASTQKPDGQKMLEDSSAILKEAINKINSIFDRLDVPTFREMDLAEAVEKIIEDHNQQKPLHFALDGYYKEINSLPSRTKLIVYQIVKGLLDYYSRDTAATKAILSLAVADNQIAMQLHSDAAPCEDNPENWLVELRKIKNRIDFYGGNMEWLSDSQYGCTLNLSLPLHIEEIIPYRNGLSE